MIRNPILNPGDSIMVNILYGYKFVPDREYHLNLSATLKDSTLWAKKGYEITAEQLCLRPYRGKNFIYPTTFKPDVHDINDSIVVTGKKFTAIFQKSCGTLCNYKVGSKTIIDKPLRLNLFRLPTDNDKPHTQEWDEMGLRDIKPTYSNLAIVESSEANIIKLEANTIYTTSAGKVFNTRMIFNINGDGEILVHSEIDPVDKGVIIPRIGLRTELPYPFNKIRYYGRGPTDSYADRKENCSVGIYNLDLKGNIPDYVLPQECGNKEGVRWIELLDDSGEGILISNPELMAVSAADYRAEDQYIDMNHRVMHPHEIMYANKIILNLDAANRALGNASCGPDVLENFELKTSETSLDFKIQPVIKRD